LALLVDKVKMPYCAFSWFVSDTLRGFKKRARNLEATLAVGLVASSGSKGLCHLMPSTSRNVSATSDGVGKTSMPSR
jgi:hypothetical protein